KEKEIIKMISLNNGERVSSLLDGTLDNIKIVINVERKSLTIHHRTVHFMPTNEELLDINPRSQILFERIFLIVSLINYLMEEGYITLYSNRVQPNIDSLGDSTIPDGGLIQEYEDEFVKTKYINSHDKLLINNPELTEFVKLGYITEQKKRETWQYYLSWIGISIALITSLTSIILNLNKKQEKAIIENQAIIINETTQIKNQLDNGLSMFDTLKTIYKDQLIINSEILKANNRNHGTTIKSLNRSNSNLYQILQTLDTIASR
ncbi:MAG: hypothetical protein Q7J06_10145, partial [Bacteroidales bacterium]|nr:hypothetical protein [Bacteroidales bacterium]